MVTIPVAASAETSSDEPPHILALNSYHKGYRGTDEAVEGIEDVLARELPAAVLSVEYMDTKRVAPSDAYFQMLAELYAAKYADRLPDVVIVTDNNALAFMVSCHEQLFASVPVVFSGVNNFTDAMLQADPRITGVVEEPDVAGAVELMLNVHPKTERVYVICDDTPTGLQNAALAREAASMYAGTVEFIYLYGPDRTLAELLDMLGNLDEGSLVLYLDLFHDSTSEYLDIETTSKAITAASAVPVYTHSDIHVGWGVVGGRVTSGRLGGEMAARMAVRLLKGNTLADVPIVRRSPTMLLFDQRALDHWNVPAERLPAGSTILYRHVSFYERYKGFVWAVALTVLAMALIIVMLLINIIRRYQAERELRSQRRLLSDVLANIPHFVYWRDREGRFLGCNRKVLDVLGLHDPSDIIGKTDAEMDLPEACTSRFEANSRRVMETGEPAMNCAETLTLGDGTEMHVLKSLVPLLSDRGEVTGVLGVWLDITERKELEQRLSESEKMRALGQLAGGIAHDFNNILVAVQGNAQLLLAGLPKDSENEELAQEILSASQRAGDLTRKLLGFARRERMETTSVDLHETIRDVIDLLTHSIDRRIDIVHELNAQQAVVSGDPSQLHSTILNLTLNARDAMPEGGTLTVRTGNVPLCMPGDQRGAVGDDGDGIELTIADTGEGIDETTRPKIFEPFFTTKGSGAGTGLGLAAVYGCVRSHHGRIDVESRPGEGTAFRLTLPLSDRQIVAPTSAKAPQTGEGRILLVDDEQPVRDFATRALDNLGYEVVAQPDGEEAIAWFREHHATVGVVILDMIMPRMSGPDALGAMRQIDPDVPIVFCSGYSTTNVGELCDRYDNVAFVAKPFAIEELAATIARHRRITS
ncbi:MAG: response regulator [Planctomycetes bacterium]|nr:response regulator [Planctomycetota bacterium]